MRALVYEAPGKLDIAKLDDPRPGPGDVLLEVAAAGVCGTDHHLVAGELGVPAGVVPGHEICGRIVEAGPEVTEWELGAQVVCYPQVCCGRCDACREGHSNRCTRPDGFGLDRQGGFAELIAVPVDCCVALPEGVTAEVGAIATDAIATPFHALTTVGHLAAGENVVVVGCGGLGVHAVLLARLAGAGQVVGVDTSPLARDAALAAGADAVLDPGAHDDPAKALRRLVRNTTLALEFVGRAETVELGCAGLAPGGRVVVVGVGHDRPRLPPLIRLVGMELAVSGSFGSTLPELRTVLDLAASGRLDTSRSVGRIVALEDGPGIFTEPPTPARTILVP